MMDKKRAVLRRNFEQPLWGYDWVYGELENIVKIHWQAYIYICIYSINTLMKYYDMIIYI